MDHLLGVAVVRIQAFRIFGGPRDGEEIALPGDTKFLLITAMNPRTRERQIGYARVRPHPVTGVPVLSWPTSWERQPEEE